MEHCLKLSLVSVVHDIIQVLNLLCHVIYIIRIMKLAWIVEWHVAVHPRHTATVMVSILNLIIHLLLIEHILLEIIYPALTHQPLIVHL